MIIKGGAACNVGFWSYHLMRDDTNEEVRLVQISGVLADNLGAALRIMQAIARQSRSRGNFMYQANINPPADVHLTDAQWLQAVEFLEKNLKLQGHQRVIVEHLKSGRRHRHVIWNRVGVESLKVVDIKGNYRVHVRTARELEQVFGLAPTPLPSLDRKSKNDELWERRVDETSGVPRSQISANLARIWLATSTGAGFTAALEKAGYILARGDRRDFCIVDPTGRAHSLARRLPDVSPAEIHLRMSDVDRNTLASVTDARARQRARNGALNPVFRTLDRQLLAATNREVLRHQRSQRKYARRQSTRINPMAAFRAARALTKPPHKFADVQRHILRPTFADASRMAGSAGTVHTTTNLTNSTLPARSARTFAPVRPSADADFDVSVNGRAQAAFEAEFAKWQAQLDAVSADQSLSPEQRAAAMVTLRARQSLEADAARRRIVEEEKQRVRAAKRHAPSRPSDQPKRT